MVFLRFLSVVAFAFSHFGQIFRLFYILLIATFHVFVWEHQNSLFTKILFYFHQKTFFTRHKNPRRKRRRSCNKFPQQTRGTSPFLSCRFSQNVAPSAGTDVLSRLLFSLSYEDEPQSLRTPFLPQSPRTLKIDASRKRTDQRRPTSAYLWA